MRAYLVQAALEAVGLTHRRARVVGGVGRAEEQERVLGEDGGGLRRGREARAQSEDAKEEQ